jgi:hypothetical protein
MKLLFLLFPIFMLGQRSPQKGDTITVKLNFEVTGVKKFLDDTIYICKNDKRLRFTKDSIYIYGFRQYLKLKR